MARVEDISDEIPPGDVRKANKGTWRFWRLFPPGTVHLVAVGSAVGGCRSQELGASPSSRERHLPRKGLVCVGRRWVPMGKTYGDVQAGDLVALVDSDGKVEVAARDGSAAERLGIGLGSGVRLQIPPSPEGQ